MASLAAERIAFVKEEFPYLEGGVLRTGDRVVYFILSDASRAYRLWRRIL